MTPFLLDTNAVSDAMRNHPKVQSRISRHRPQLITSVIVIGEIRYGLERIPPGKRRADLTLKADGMFSTLVIEPITVSVAERYAVIRTATENKGFSLNDNDLWIAASALELGAVLISRDGDFACVPGLTVEDWTQ